MAWLNRAFALLKADGIHTNPQDTLAVTNWAEGEFGSPWLTISELWRHFSSLSHPNVRNP
jgi:hypothetical protein